MHGAVSSQMYVCLRHRRQEKIIRTNILLDPSLNHLYPGVQTVSSSLALPSRIVDPKSEKICGLVRGYVNVWWNEPFCLRLSKLFHNVIDPYYENPWLSRKRT